MDVAAPVVQSRPRQMLVPLSGLVAIAFFVAAFVVHDLVGNTPSADAPAADFSRYYQEEDGSIWGAGILLSLGALFFFWFIGALRTAVRAAEGAMGRLTATGFAGGIAFVTLILASFGTQLSAAILVSDRDQPMPAATAVTYWWMGDGLFVMSFYAAAVFVGATGYVMLRSTLAPRWAAWLTMLIALALLVPWVNWAAFLFALPIWVVGVSLLLWRRQGTEAMTQGT